MSLIQKYIWVIKTIHRAGRITLKELNEKWRENIVLYCINYLFLGDISLIMFIP